MAERMRGALPTPRNRLAAAQPYPRAAAAVPSQWIRLPRTLSMWKNDTYGCCVTSEEAFARACSGVFIGDAEVVRWAGVHGALNGAYIDRVMDQFIGDGFRQDGNVYDGGRKAAVDYTDPDLLDDAIYAGPVKIGVAADQLHRAVGAKNGWVGVDFRRDPNLDHCISLCGYGPIGWLAEVLGASIPAGVSANKLGYAAFTWDTVGILDLASMIAITGEAWSRSPVTVTVGNNPPTPDVVYTPGVTPPPPPGPPPHPAPDFTLTFARRVKKGQTWSNVARQDIDPGKYDVFRARAAETGELTAE